MPADTELRTDYLRASDADAVFALHERVMTHTPTGHLTPRSHEEIQSLLADPNRSMSVGAWSDNRLVAYSLCYLEAGSAERSTPIMRLLAETGEPVWRGKGMVVDPEYRGRSAAGALVKMQQDVLLAKQIMHAAMLVATTNLASLKGTLRATVWAVGLEHDNQCENFVGYGGTLQRHFDIVERMTLPAQDLERFRELFRDGWVGLEVNGLEAGASPTITFGRAVLRAGPDPVE